MKKKLLKTILPASITCIIVAIIIFLVTSGGQSGPVADVVSDQKSHSSQADEGYYFSESELRKKVEEIAKQRFGDDAFVMFLSPEGPSEVVIEEIKRKVYIYAADSLSAHDKTGEVRGLYHVDVNTGEIFDNGSGTMEKVLGE